MDTFEVVNKGNTDMLFYAVIDFGGGFSAKGSGSIPASSVNVSGGSVNTGNVKVTLNVNTCDVTGFTTNYGPCGTFDVTWVEMPASIGGSTATHGDMQQTMPGGKVVTNGTSLQVGDTATGTVSLVTGLNYNFDNLSGNLTQFTNVTVTIITP